MNSKQIIIVRNAADLPPVHPALEGIILGHGTHPTREDGMCVMEAVAFIAGEEHSDHPACACPALSNAARRLNDARWSSDEARTAALAPIAAFLIGTRTDDRNLTLRRAYILVDSAVRESVPLALEASGLKAQAEQLRALAPIVDRATAELAKDAAREVRAAAYDAAYAADAAYYAADAAAAYAAADRDAPLLCAAGALIRACRTGKGGDELAEWTGTITVETEIES